MSDPPFTTGQEARVPSTHLLVQYPRTNQTRHRQNPRHYTWSSIRPPLRPPLDLSTPTNPSTRSRKTPSDTIRDDRSYIPCETVNEESFGLICRIGDGVKGGAERGNDTVYDLLERLGATIRMGRHLT